MGAMTIRTENPLAYVSWQAMKRRCDDSSTDSWPDYGGRGITYVRRWAQFDNFIADMGERPSRAYSLERRNHNRNYGPRNCIWIPKWEQALNKRIAYFPRSGWQRGTLEELFPPLGDAEHPFMVARRQYLAITRDFLRQGGKWAAKGI